MDGKGEGVPTSETERRLEHPGLPDLLDAIPDPAILIDDGFRIQNANRAYTEKFGYGEDLTGRFCYEVSHRYRRPCDEMGESCPIRRSRETGAPSRVLHVHFTPDGRELEDVTIHPLPNGDRESAFFLETLKPAQPSDSRADAQQMVGRSPAFNRMLELALRVADRQTTVLLLGESGTGKELLAKAIHDRSPRASANFVPVDCSSISETLFESELFGHEKGAFTGAMSRKVGLVEAAAGGTVFLDEIGDMPTGLQVKLLRLLESALYRRVGSAELQKADFRLICATHRNLRELVARGDFREDLYYRISVFPIRLPTLRERMSDLPLLIEVFSRRLGCPKILRVDPQAMAAIESYPFPGNVRELLNVLERACLLADGECIGLEHLPREIAQSGEPQGPLPVAGEVLPLQEIERRYLKWASERFEGRNRELAAKLGVSERTLYRKLRASRS